MKLPERPTSHIAEAASWRLLQSIAPETWIVREVSERDYGIDAYIELVSQKGRITGKLLSVQLKGVNRIDWKAPDGGTATAKSPSIKTTTANYWLQLPVPVFLFVADLSASNIVFVAAQEAIRAQYHNLDTQNTISFNLSDSHTLTSPRGLELFHRYYARQRFHSEFVFHIANLISQVQTYGNFIRMNQNRDIFLEVDSERHMLFRALYETCRMTSIYLGRAWTAMPLAELYEMDRQEWKDEYVRLHEKTLDQILQEIEKLFPDLVRKSISQVTEIERSYWFAMDPVFFELCNSGDIEWTLKQIEAEAGR